MHDGLSVSPRPHSTHTAVRLLSAALLTAALAAGLPHAARADGVDAAVRRIADLYAGAAVADGTAVGVAVGVVLGDRPPLHFAYGKASLKHGDVVAETPVTENTVFEIGSTTKVFTTNLFGQMIAAGEIGLDDRLGDFRRFLGPLPGLKPEITLRELGDFTSGLLDGRPECRRGEKPSVTGCVPPGREGYLLSVYGAQELMALIRHTTLRNWQSGTRATALPAEYNYSNVGISLLGLILGGPRDAPITNRAMWRWFDGVERRILRPLGMNDTFLRIPAAAVARTAWSYGTAIARPIVENGALAAVEVTYDGGGAYRAARPPVVTVLDGGGRGAAAVAVVEDGSVARVEVAEGGRGYVAPPAVRAVGRVGGRSVELLLEGRVLVSAGAVVGVHLDHNPSFDAPPRLAVLDGRRAGEGRAAALRARMTSGRLAFVEVVDGGAGYVAPLKIVVAPGARTRHPISIGSPAGLMRSTIVDMAVFTQAALGERRANRRPVPAAIRRGFRIAQRPHACNVGPPALATCAQGAGRTGLAWNILPGVGGGPTVVSKNGEASKFTTLIMLIPEQRIGVVVMATNADFSADAITHNIGYELSVRCASGGLDCP